MKIKLLHLLFFYLLWNNIYAQTGIQVPELVAFDNSMNTLLSQYNLPGAQLAITYRGRLVYNRGFGYANTATQTLVQPSNVFRIASVSKPITSVAIHKMMQDGLLSLNDKVFGVNGILNDVQYQTPKDNRVNNITVKQLLQHSAGWNSSIAGDYVFNNTYMAIAMQVPPPINPDKLLEYVIKNKNLNFAPGTAYSYSNTCYLTLGLIIEKISGLSYENYVKQNILAPCGINDMNLGGNLLTDQLPNEVIYYDYPGAPMATSVYNSTQTVPWPYGGFDLGGIGAAGAWTASAESLCKLLVRIDRYSTKTDILTTSTIDSLIKPSINNANYANGIEVNTFNNWWHSGSLPGTSSLIVRNASKQLNWVIITNTRSNPVSTLVAAIDNLVWNTLPSITTWPSGDIFTSVEELNSAIKIRIYPNLLEAEQTINIDTENKIEEITIYDLLGRVKLNNKNVNNNQQLISDYSSGIYLIKIKTNKGTGIYKFQIK